MTGEPSDFDVEVPTAGKKPGSLSEQAAAKSLRQADLATLKNLPIQPSPSPPRKEYVSKNSSGSLVNMGQSSTQPVEK